MCGIAGAVSFDKDFNISQEELIKSAECLKFRGPDQEGYYIDSSKRPSVFFAHKRLSIIDLSEKGRQPMHSISGRTKIVFNGEIYNYKDLKQKLDRTQLRSSSDTEVILELYEQYGIHKTIEMLDGMFAFCLVDMVEQTVHLVRDRFGKKPLYYAVKDQTIFFSSDIRSFRSFPVKLSVDTLSLVYYFHEMCTPDGKSIWKEVQKLPAGYRLTFNEYGPKTEKYWDIDYAPKTEMQESEIIDHCRELLHAAVRKRLVADVPVGCFLSGGIDSGLVAAIASKELNRPLTTFTVGFDISKYNELEGARKVADKYGTDHHEITVDSNDLNIMDRLIGEFGEPFADSSMIPTYYVSRFASSQTKVVMGGDGGDELFAGYNTHKQGWRMQRLMRLKALKPIISMAAGITGSSKLKQLKKLLRYDPELLAGELYRSMGFSAAQLLNMLPANKSDILDLIELNAKVIELSDAHASNVFDKLMYGSVKTRLVNDYLVKVDRSSMFSSLEVRSPFLDKDLAEFTARIPHGILMKNGEPKSLLKKLAAEYIPHENIYKPKQGFAIPVGDWIRTDFTEHFRSVIFDVDQNLIDLDYKFLKKIFDRHVSGENHTHRIFTAYVFHKWVADGTN